MTKFLILVLCFLFLASVEANASTEVVRLHRSNVQIGDAVCVGGFDGVPIVYSCDDARSLRFFGIYDGKNDDGETVAITEGLVVANINNKGWPVKKGELLTTSGNEGHLMRQKDNILKAETVARVVSEVSFDSDGEGLQTQKVTIEIVRYVQTLQ